jgi:hypothetical protein
VKEIKVFETLGAVRTRPASNTSSCGRMRVSVHYCMGSMPRDDRYVATPLFVSNELILSGRRMHADEACMSGIAKQAQPLHQLKNKHHRFQARNMSFVPLPILFALAQPQHQL